MINSSWLCLQRMILINKCWCDFRMGEGEEESGEYALKLIEGSGISMSACREIAVSLSIASIASIILIMYYFISYIRILYYIKCCAMNC